MNKEILKLAIPNIISNISVPLLSTVDTALMGHQSSLHLASVGIASMIFNLLYWNFGFLRMGTTGLSAQAYGENDNTKLTNTLLRALFLSLFISLVLIIFQKPIIEIVAYFMNIDQNYYTLVVEYFEIRIFAAPATLGLYVMFGWFFGLQNAIIPLIITLFINIVNIILSYYFVEELNLSIQGVAYGTLISQYAGILLAFILLIRYKNRLQKGKNEKILDKYALMRFFSINRDIFIRTVALTFAFAFFYAQSAKQGEMALAITVILLQFLSWISFGVDGFAYAAESLVGKYFGAKNRYKFYQAIRYSFYWGFLLAVFYALIYYFGGEWILKLYTDKSELIEAVKPYLFWTVLMGFAGVAAFVWDGIFIGMTASKEMRDTLLISLAIFIAIFYILQPFNSLHLYWFNFLLFLFIRGILQSWIFYKREEFGGKPKL